MGRSDPKWEFTTLLLVFVPQEKQERNPTKFSHYDSDDRFPK